MNPLTCDPTFKPSAPLTSYERDAILKRRRTVAVALGHPTWTAEQSAALTREKAELEQTLAAEASRQPPLQSLTEKGSPRGMQN